MKKWIFLIVIVGMLGYAVYTTVLKEKDTAREEEKQLETVNKPVTNTAEAGDAKGDPNKVGLAIGNIAPDFELKTMDGETKKLSDFRGEPTMLNFWATWCPPCQAEMPDMEKFYKDTQMPIVSVNLTKSERSMDSVKEFIKDYKLTFPIMLDEKLDASKKYAIQPIPTTYILDKDGRIHAKRIGPMNYDYMVAQYEELK